MKQICKRSLAAILLLVMLVGYFSGITIRVNAASYVYNWGERGEIATELSDAAEAWYAKYNTSYAKLSAYSGASSVSSVPSSALYKQLKTLMSTAHTSINSYNDNKTLAKYTDCQNGGGAISSFYSGKSIGPSWDGSWNREHTWPNSKGLGGNDENDVMMIRPTSISENSSRGNTAYGKSSSYYHPNQESDKDKNYDSISSGELDLRGDCARICLYVYVRWGNTGKMWGSSGVMESKDVLLEWMEEDPVDTWELGRNDSCQSITGTRNVFVDYPELAFDLFNAEIPNNYDTPSGSAPAYTITATSNNTSYGTVSLSGKTITATPKTGYLVSGYTVTSGSATVTRSGNIFTVIPSTNCTVRINFEPRVQSTVTFVDRGITQTTKTAYNGDAITIPGLTRTQPDGYLFRGWVEQQISSTQTKPVIYGENTSYTVTGNKTFYALYAKVADGSTGEAAYRLVTSAEQLSQGTSVVIAAATSPVAMKQTGGTNNRYAGTIQKKDDDTITFDENVPIDVLTLGAGSTAGTYSFYSEANGQYLAAGTTSGSNILKLQSSVDAAASFTIAVASDGTATVTSKTSSDRKVLQYNSSNNIFSCYASGQKAISLYAYIGGGISYYTTSPVLCDHTDTQNVPAKAATCTESGYTAGVYCNDCGCYISGYEQIPALGHSYTGTVTTEPTCTTSGVKTFTCEGCGDSYTQLIAAIDHTYQTTVIPPTATEMGYTIYTCSGCGDSYEEDYVEALGETFTVKFCVPNGVTAVADMQCTKTGITLPAAGVPSGDYTFAGWTTGKLEDTTEEPATVYAAGSNFKATANTTLYALYTYKVADGNGYSDEYVVCSGEITEGDYVIVYNGSALVAADADSSGRLDYATVTADGNVIKNPGATIIWHIAPDGAYWTLYNEQNGVYAAGTGAKNKATTIKTLTDFGKWTVTGDGTYEFKNLGNSNKGVNALLRCNGNYGYACYSGSTGGVLTLYRAGAGATTYYTTISPEEPTVEFWNITLGDDISVNFVIPGASEVSFTVAGQPAEVQQDDDTYTLCLAAAQMTDEIVISVDGVVLEETYSVRAYADEILAGSHTEETKNLVKAMLCYGGAAQTAFNYNTEALASDGISVNAAIPTGETEIAVTDDLSAVNFYGASLVHENRIAVRFYFTGDVTGLTFSQGTPVQKDKLTYVEIANINPQSLGNTITLTLTDENGKTLTVGYSPLTYIVRIYSKTNTAETTKALVQALYQYYLAAKAYIA